MERGLASPGVSADEAGSVGEWLGGEDLWRVGFHVGSLELVSLLSGLVEVVLAVYEETPCALVLIVRVTDQTHTLFRQGSLSGNSIFRYRKVHQPLMVATRYSKPERFFTN